MARTAVGQRGHLADEVVPGIAVVGSRAIEAILFDVA